MDTASKCVRHDEVELPGEMVTSTLIAADLKADEKAKANDCRN